MAARLASLCPAFRAHRPRALTSVAGSTFPRAAARFAALPPDRPRRLATVASSSNMGDAQATSELSFGPWKIARTEVFKSTELSFAFVNIRPLVPGHVLVSPMRIVARFSELRPEEVADLWTTAHEIGKKIEPHFGATSMTYAIQDGPAAGQTVPHVHIHILPRKAEDFPNNDDVYGAIEANEGEVDAALRAAQSGQKLDLDVQRTNRSPEEMAAEAAELAALFP
eukprot:jgi/Tetstr1/455225/TSEL_042073.t2